MTWILLSGVLHNMLLYVEDQKQEKEPQGFKHFKCAVVQAAANSAYIAPKELEQPGDTVCVGAFRTFSGRGLVLWTLHILPS